MTTTTQGRAKQGASQPLPQQPTRVRFRNIEAAAWRQGWNGDPIIPADFHSLRVVTVCWTPELGWTTAYGLADASLRTVRIDGLKTIFPTQEEATAFLASLSLAPSR